ncbi:hypothetical protein POTOM_006429 [Populus tomentosa]|uniref:Sugar phosphate transporter domain-containing protein n=1 Tax=Populus tomentosa TaxID=118781 RepID=A0A8X8D7F8_POPTO|nr:hypothetical protein POTOM_006429 [Populus tomentosa]
MTLCLLLLDFLLLVLQLSGQALEELRGSLYNDIRTSEGAKRQQQRLCGPAVAMTFNFMAAVGVIMANKLVNAFPCFVICGCDSLLVLENLAVCIVIELQHQLLLDLKKIKIYGHMLREKSHIGLYDYVQVMKKVGFNFPIFLTLIHYSTSWILLGILRALSLLPVSPPSKATPFAPLFSLGVVMSFASGLANASLNHNSVGFYQMAKIAVTPSIVLAEFVLFRKTISYKKVLALVVVSGGVAVATVKDLEFNFFGACIAIAWIVPSSINKILWSNLQQHANWTALALMWKTTPVTIFFLVALMPCLDPPGLLSFKWDLYSSSTIFLTALLGFLLQWSGALALGATSATSHVVLGQFKSCVILLGGFLIFGSDPGFVSICGALTALAGMSVYTSLNLQESRENLIFQLQTQTLPLSKPKTKLGTTTTDDQT